MFLPELEIYFGHRSVNLTAGNDEDVAIDEGGDENLLADFEGIDLGSDPSSTQKKTETDSGDNLLDLGGDDSAPNNDTGGEVGFLCVFAVPSCSCKLCFENTHTHLQ